VFKLVFGDPVELPALLTDLFPPEITARLDLHAATPAPTELPTGCADTVDRNGRRPG
jgi:hypothetical protein